MLECGLSAARDVFQPGVPSLNFCVRACGACRSMDFRVLCIWLMCRCKGCLAAVMLAEYLPCGPASQLRTLMKELWGLGY